jgi:hypothetical protein
LYASLAVWRNGGNKPADSFVGIWKCIARPNLCETPACVKPPPRYVQVEQTDKRIKKELNRQNILK